MESNNLKKGISSRIKGGGLELFKKDICPQRISVSFKKLSDTSDSSSFLKTKILQFKDISNPERKVIINFDLEGRLISIELSASSPDANVKILERSFGGKFYVYMENCENLKSEKRNIYRYYDYYNEAISEDLEISKFLIDAVNSLLENIHEINYKSTNEIIIGEVESINVVKILENARKIYDWKGLMQERLLLKKIYPTPISVLPPEARPDQNPIFAVLQITQGCWIKDLKGPCKFCSSYNNISYKEKDINDLEKHIKQVKKFTGRNWKYVKKFFLADADPFHTNINSEIYLKFIAKETPDVNWYESFVSTATILSKSPNEWKKLMNLGLKKLYWGVESADDKTLKILGKPHNKKLLYRVATVLNKSNISYVCILLSGVGNLSINQQKDSTSNSHIIETVKFIQNINCPNVYVSRFIPQPDTEIFNLLKEKKLNIISLSEKEKEHRMIIKMISYDKENCFAPVRDVRGTYGVQFNQ